MLSKTEESISAIKAKVGSFVAKATRTREDRSKCAIIDQDVNINGDLDTDGDVQVEGQINGNVSCAHLTIGHSGTVNGDIKAQEVIIRGKVKGAIRAKDVTLLQGSDVGGDISYDRMSMEEGAAFNGMCNNGKDETTAAQVEAMQRAAARLKAI
jgi:cytoskeletal protein CcmA (bactofilin family)